MERNKAFKEALETWREIRRLKPDDPQTADEIDRLEDRLQYYQQLGEYINRLAHRLKEIELIFTKVITPLQKMRETGDVDEALVSIVEDFLEGHLPADDFITTWQALTTASTKWQALTTSSTKEEPDYRALADRLKRGEIVLFLGSDILRLLQGPAPLETLVPELAQQAHYQGYADSLSMIAEYYQMTGYGRSSLVRQLQTVISPAAPDISLYRLLARIEQPLVLISANYDLFLEHQLRQTGRKYALIASIIISNPPDCELGNVIVHYSDRDAPDFLRLEEELSSLKLIEKGYALIYKIRGYCNAAHEPMAYQHNILTLAGENYFTFARHMDRLIPNYLVKQFAARGLFFLGYSPRHWEDRLLVNGILDKCRHQQYERAQVITEDTDPFVRAYWDSRGVLRYEMSELTEFVRRLEEYLQ